MTERPTEILAATVANTDGDTRLGDLVDLLHGMRSFRKLRALERLILDIEKDAQAYLENNALDAEFQRSLPFGRLQHV